MDEYCVAMTTIDSESAGLELVRGLVGERLVACAQVLPAMHSVYEWKGNVEEDRENLILLKTRRARVEALIRRIKELHPYEVPEVIVLPIVDGLPEYLCWLEDQTGGRND